MTNEIYSKEPRYNLSFVIQETGIKADTLRAWERRYQLPQPQRTEGGHRLFSEYDIQTIKWLMARQKEGMSISRAVKLWRDMEGQGQDPLSPPLTDSLQSGQVQTDKNGGEGLIDIRNAWIQACLNYDEATGERLLTQAFAQFPMETVCVEILQSGISTIGTLWHEGKASVQQEHFASELTNRRLQALVAAAPKPVREKTVLVACPPEERHTISALLTTLFLRHRSWHVVYLGANVPHDRLKETIETTKPDLVVLVAMRLETSATLAETAAFLHELNVPVAFGGWIFNHIPELAQKIPGHYLDGDLMKGITIIENLLKSGAPPVDYTAIPEAYAETIAHFIENKYQIETQALEAFVAKMGNDVPVKNIQDANMHLAKDIIAALTLGDLSIIQSDLEWVEGLITNRDHAGDMLFNYLLAYYESSQAHLDEPGTPIIEWLASVIQTKA